MATNYMTTEDLNRLGIKWRERDGALVPAARVGLHPEADARLSAAPVYRPGPVYRIEAAVTNGPRFALTGTLAEIDARLRSGLVGVDMATGATGKASEWPMVAEKMRAEWARTVAAASGTAATWNGVPAPSGTVMVAGSEEGARINSITVVRGNRTETHTFDAVTVRSGDKVSAECDAEGKWTARVRGAAPGSYARAQAVDFTGAGATLTDRYESVKAIRDSVTERMRAKESQRPKPATLAAGQVWERGDTQWILDEQEPKHPSFWNARTSIGQRGLLSASTVMGMQYIGTREDVAAREAGPSARAMRVGAAVAEGMARGVAMGMSRTPLGTMPVLTAESWRDHGTAKDLACVTSARLGAKVAIREDPMRGIVYVSVEGAPARIVDEAIQDVRRFVPSYVAVLPEPVTPETAEAAQRLRVAQKMSEVYNAAQSAFDNPDRWEAIPDGADLAKQCAKRAADIYNEGRAKPSPLAALRAEIDALIAADSGPFAHARAAALRCYGEAIPSGLGEPIALRDVGRLHAALLRYESVRCGARTPAATHDARREAGLIEPAVVATYERERARSDVYARPARRY